MLIVSYLKIGMRMSIENVSTTMKEMFGIAISEGEVRRSSTSYPMLLVLNISGF